MSKQAPNLEWEIVESDADWERLHSTRLLDITSDTLHGLRRQRSLSTSVVLLLLMAVTGGWWRSFHTGVQQTEVGVKATVQPELGAVEQHSGPSLANLSSSRSDMDWYQSARKYNGLLAEPFKIPLDNDQAAAQREMRAVEQVGGSAAVRLPGDQTTSTGLPGEGLGEYRSLYTAVQTTELADHGDITVSTVEVGGSRGIAHIVTTHKDGAPAYRQTRFYRRIGPDWRQIPPDATLWGSVRSLETPSFVFRFRQHDAQVVIAAASRIDALYTTLWHNFGLPIMPTPGRLAIYASGTQNPGTARFEPHNYENFVWEDRLVVASPSLYLAPVELTDADLLAQSVALPLIDSVLAQASERYQIGSTWQPMMNGLGLWQVWDMDLPLALWREEIVQWIYLDRPGAGSAQTVVLPRQYEPLCASHALWMETPTMLGIPLVCNRLDREAWYTGEWGPRHPPARLDHLAVPAPDGYAPEGTPVWGQTIALATLIEYAVATYGRERLPELVAGLGHYERWETLIPAVFGVSVAQFEHGWQAYLSAHYGVSLDIPTQ